jgi:hypothetical protein
MPIELKENQRLPLLLVAAQDLHQSHRSGVLL